MELNAANLNKKIDEQVGPIYKPSYSWGKNSVVFKFNQLQLMKRVRDDIGRMITGGARAIALTPKDDPGAYRRYGLVVDWKEEDNVNNVIENNLRWLIVLYRMVQDEGTEDTRYGGDLPAGGSANAGGKPMDDYKSGQWKFAPGLEGTGPDPKPGKDAF
jgi:hypothetical protein